MNLAVRFALTAILVSMPVAAETIDAGPFSVDVTGQLTIRLNGKPLFNGDRSVSFRGLKPGEPVLVDPARGQVIRQDNIFTVTARRGRNSLRREIMVTPEAVHLTYELKVFGYTGGSHLQYDLLSPVEFLDGVDYDAWTGLARGPIKKTTATFNSQESESFKYLVQTVRYFVLKRPGSECSVDFNPGGLWEGESNYGDKCSATPYHDGKQFHFAMLCSGGKFGGIMRGKVVIRPGNQSYESLHSTTPVAYTKGYPVSAALNFSNGDSHGDYRACSPDAPDGNSFRWHNADQVRIVERPTGGVLYHDFATAADGKSDGVLELKQRSGLYLLTLNVLDTAEDTGPFTVSGPKASLFEDVHIERGKYWFKTAALRIRNGKADLRFTGDWKIGALTLQPILYETEDFLFDRPFWNMEIGDPDLGSAKKTTAAKR
jgi:hypothetical protein